MIFANALNRLAERMLHVPLIGLDISDRSIKFIQFSGSHNDVKIETFGSTELSEGIVVDGEVKNPELLAGALASLKVKGSGVFRDRFVAASLPEEKSFLRVIRVPRVKMEQLENTVRWGLEENIPLSLEEVYFDYEVVRQGEPDHIDVLTVAFPRAIVDSYANALRAGNFTPLALELESQSLARSLIDRQHPGDSRVLVDIGASRTSFVLIAEGTIALTSTMRLSGRDITKAIADAFGLRHDEAEKIKFEAGLRDDLYEGQVKKVLQPFMDTLVREIEKHMEFYRDHMSVRHGASTEIDSVVLTGGDANLIGLDAHLARALRKPVLVGDPFSGLKPLFGNYLPSIPRREALQFATAIGLGMRDMNF